MLQLWDPITQQMSPSLEGSLRHVREILIEHCSGTIDGQGAIWWDNCTKCHYPPGNDSSFCEIASRPKLLEIQFVDGLHVRDSMVATLILMASGPRRDFGHTSETKRFAILDLDSSLHAKHSYS